MELRQAGFSLIEIMIVLAVLGVTMSFMLPSLIAFQSQAISEISKDDLADRGTRVLDYLAEELRMTGYMVTSNPRYADETSVVLKHNTVSGTPLVTFANSIRVSNANAADDEITILKAASFFPRVGVETDAASGAGLAGNYIDLDRAPTDTGEVKPGAASAYSLVAFSNHKAVYRVDSFVYQVDSFESSTKTDKLELNQGIEDPISGETAAGEKDGTELLAVRANRIYVSGGALHLDNYEKDQTLDFGVDGLQFRYLLADGSFSDAPLQPDQIRGIQFFLLIRSLTAEKDLNLSQDYSSQMGPNVTGGTYAYNDRFRRSVLTELIEVKNYAFD